MKRVLLSANEPSADVLGAALVEALAARTRFLPVGLGGDAMRAAGVLALPESVESTPVMGAIEVVRQFRAIATNASAVRAAFADAELFVPIDAPDFNVPLAREARRRNIPVVGYVSPQVWAWRPARAKHVAAAMNRLLCLFAFEPPLYASFGLDARWVGHPVVDRVAPSALEPGVLALFPGSRRDEVVRLLPDFLAAAALTGATTVLVARAPGLAEATLRATVKGALADNVVFTTAEEARARASRAISKSGTVTLELALAGVPTVVAHRVHPVTYTLGRTLVTGVQHLALPNILLRREVMREFVQVFTPEELARAVEAAAALEAGALTDQLGLPGAADRAAGAMLDLL